MDVEHVRVWAVVFAALGNAAVILGFSTAIESLYWLWRELTLKDPVVDWVPPPSEPGLRSLRVAHLSDLHIVGERYGYRMESGTHGPRGNHCIRNTIRKLSETHKLNPLDRVLVTGDITDAGTRAEWAAFIDLLRGCPELRQHLSFVPGNHDVNIVDRTNAARLDLPWSSAQALRKLRFVLALDAIQGERAHIVDRTSRSLGPSLSEYLREGERAKHIRALAERGDLRGRWEMAKIWEAIFPLVEPPPTEDGYGLILLDSNAVSHSLLPTRSVSSILPSLRHLSSCCGIHLVAPGSSCFIIRSWSTQFHPFVCAIASVLRSSTPRTFWPQSSPTLPVFSSSTVIGIRIGSAPAAKLFCALPRRRLWVATQKCIAEVSMFMSSPLPKMEAFGLLRASTCASPDLLPPGRRRCVESISNHNEFPRRLIAMSNNRITKETRVLQSPSPIRALALISFITTALVLSVALAEHNRTQLSQPLPIPLEAWPRCLPARE